VGSDLSAAPNLIATQGVKEDFLVKKLGITFLLMLLAFAVVALPASAKPKEPEGTEINLFTPPTTFAANTPFHVSHGWQVNTTSEDAGRFSFTLDVDGVRLKEDFVLKTPVEGFPGVVEKDWVFNFPSGLSGFHALSGIFWAPCGYQGRTDCVHNQVQAAVLNATVNFQ
jgi:hypothetical protein